MDDRTITVSISDEEQAFIRRQIAAGNYADETEMLRAGLEILKHEAKVRELRRLIAEGDADISAGRIHEYATTEDFLKDITSEEFAD